MATSKEFLKDSEREIVLFIEKFHSVAGVAPDDLSIIDYSVSIGNKLTQEELDALKLDALFIKSMEARGIIFNDPHYSKAGKLSIRQIAAASKMTDILDRRSDQKKLNDIGITTDEWSQWLLDENFVRYLHGRVERQLANSTHEAHIGLLRGVRSGNIPAIKLFYEITGRWNPEQEQTVNVRLLLGRVVEVIQKHVKDPKVLGNLATDLTQIAIEVSPDTTNTHSSVVRGELA